MAHRNAAAKATASYQRRKHVLTYEAAGAQPYGNNALAWRWRGRHSAAYQQQYHMRSSAAQRHQKRATGATVTWRRGISLSLIKAAAAARSGSVSNSVASQKRQQLRGDRRQW